MFLQHLKSNSIWYIDTFCADEQILREEGCKDFSQYLAVPGTPEKDLIPDFFLDDVDDPQQVIASGKGESKVSLPFNFSLDSGWV